MPVLEAFRDHFRPHNALLVHDGRYTQPNAHVYMPRFVSAGGEIYAQGQTCGGLYKVEFGAVRVFRLLADGRRQISAFHLAGEVFGFEADNVHHFFAEAICATGIQTLRPSPERDLAGELSGRFRSTLLGRNQKILAADQISVGFFSKEMGSARYQRGGAHSALERRDGRNKIIQAKR